MLPPRVLGLSMAVLMLCSLCAVCASTSVTAADSGGSKIAFTSDRDGNAEIYVMNPDGSGQTWLTDNGAYDGEPAWSPVSVNTPPIANAGPDQTVKTKSTVKLDGSGSKDPNGDTLTYAWELTAQPAKSKAQLSDVTAVKPTFTPDKTGTYTIQLVVTDEHGAQSVADEVIVTAVNKPPK